MADQLNIDAKFKWEGRELTVLRGEYQYGTCRQPAFLCFDDADPECSVSSGMPYGVLTVNLDDPACELLQDGDTPMQFVDVNNWPGIEDILKDVTWCEPAMVYRQSGFVKYPVYLFSPDIAHV